VFPGGKTVDKDQKSQRRAQDVRQTEWSQPKTLQGKGPDNTKKKANRTAGRHPKKGKAEAKPIKERKAGGGCVVGPKSEPMFHPPQGDKNQKTFSGKLGTQLRRDQCAVAVRGDHQNGQDLSGLPLYWTRKWTKTPPGGREKPSNKRTKWKKSLVSKMKRVGGRRETGVGGNTEKGLGGRTQKLRAQFKMKTQKGGPGGCGTQSTDPKRQMHSSNSDDACGKKVNTAREFGGKTGENPPQKRGPLWAEKHGMERCK